MRRTFYTVVFICAMTVLLYLRLSIPHDYAHDAPLFWSLVGGGCCGVLYMLADWWQR